MNSKRTYQETRRRSGFTLIELAVVLVVIALVVAMGVAATTGTLEAARRAQTESKLSQIEKAFLDFRNQYNRLPCPGDITLTTASANFGVEASNPGFCTGGAIAAATPATFAARGSVPAVTLGLPESFMFDGWGRKIVYAVDINVTSTAAFDYLPSNAQDCEFRVNDSAGNARSSGSMYVLLSHGPNGHGGYVTNTRISSASNETDELNNCDCTNTGAAGTNNDVFVQKDTTETFDDIVRFKERWQMQNEDDYLKSAETREYQLALGVAGNVNLYKRGCDGWIPSTTATVSPAAATAIRSLAFTYDNNFLLINSDGTNNCQYVNVTASTLSATTISSCPAASANNRFALSKNNYIALSASASPYVYFYQYANGVISAISANSSSLNNFYNNTTTSAAQPQYMAFSKGAEYFITSRSSATAEVDVMAMADATTFRAVDATISSLPSAGDIGGVAFSPDGQMLAVVDNDQDEVKRWSIGSGNPFISGGTSPFTYIANDIGVGANITMIAFSPDSQYFALVLTGAATNIEDNVRIYKLNGTGHEAATILGSYDNSSTPSQIAFTPDSNSLIISAGNYVVTLDRIGGMTFQKHLDDLNAGGSISASALIH